MKRTTAEEQLARIQEQKRRLQERSNKIQAKLRKQDRAAETRQKILLGAFLREWMERDSEMRRKATVGLERYLTRDIDRHHFGFDLRGDGTIKEATQATPAPVNNDAEPIAAAG